MTTILSTSLASDFSGHGGGDKRLVKDLLDLVRNECAPGSALTSIDKSTQSHYISLALEESRLRNGEMIDMDTYIKNI